MANRLSFNVTAMNVVLVASEMKDVGKSYILLQIWSKMDNS